MKRKKAVFTIVKDENWLLHKWLEYYLLNFNRSDIYILNHLSTTTELDSELYINCCNHLPIYNDKSFDHKWLCEVACRFQGFLLQSYEYVLFAESDEFIVPDPSKYDSLAGYIDKLIADGGQPPFVRCAGLEIQHDYENEPAIKLNQPLLSQRKYWHHNNVYAKTLLSRVPLHWQLGFHTTNESGTIPPNDDLLLIHYKKLDFDLLLKKNMDAMKRQWSEYDLANRFGIQHTYDDPSKLKTWFDSYKPYLIEIPERFKQVKGL